MSYRIVDYVSCTVSANSHEYQFGVSLSALELERLSHYRVLGMRFRKEKYQFLNDIAEVLAANILEQLEKIVDD